MFEELESLFTNIKENINEILVHKDELNLDRMGFNQAVASILSEALVEAGKQAIEEIEEFQYPPLKYQLLENLAKPEHVLTPTGRLKQTIIDEKVLGTYSDLIRGQEAAGGNTDSPNAPAVWKYGIYLPANGGSPWSDSMIDRMKLPTYEQVIDERLAAWGDKAPYWHFLENGNAGNSRAFPNFSGTTYFAQLRARVPEIISKARELFNKRLFYDLDRAVQLGINVQPKSRTRVTIFRYSIGDVNVSIQKSSSGKIFYRIGNQTFTVDEFKEALKNLI